MRFFSLEMYSTVHTDQYLYRRSRSQNCTERLESFLSMGLLLLLLLLAVPLLTPLLLLLLLLCRGRFLLAPNLDSSKTVAAAAAASSSLGEAEDGGSSSTVTPEEEAGGEDEGESVVVVCETMTNVREVGSRYMEVLCVEVASMPGGGGAGGGTEWKRPVLLLPLPWRFRKLRAKSTLLLGLPPPLPKPAAFLSLLVGTSLLLSLSWGCCCFLAPLSWCWW